MTRWRIHAPASSANLGPGFDVLGLALQLGITLELEPDRADGFCLEISGEGADSLPRDRSHRIVSIAQEIAGDAVDAAGWTVHSEIPIARGLGSSAAAHACGVAAGFLLRDGSPPSPQQLFQRVSDIEGHPDNAAACIDGGFQAASGSRSDWNHVSLPIESVPRILAVIPEVPLETKEARATLPDSYSREDAVANLGSIATLLSGLIRGDWQVVEKSCQDRFHQPFRLPLIPGLSAALEAMHREQELSGSWLSGAGPTLAAFVSNPETTVESAGSALGALQEAGTPAIAEIFSINHVGLQMEKIE